ncbi:MAG TPA: sulfotransferase [Terriglobales bacterium]|nr:sulfotransferase [Terriglobales bacterium]
MKPPIFIVGCPRSGTSFLYHLLLSAGGFAKFHTQMNVFDVLEPVYGDLQLIKNRKQMMRDWLQSKAFQVSGLDRDEIERKILSECRNASDFLRIVMREIAQKQGVDRWIDSTPTNVPHMLRIQQDFPDALFIHIIRDGRDAALSLDKHGWSRPLPWDKSNGVLAAGLYWEWIVRKGRASGTALGSHYIEIRYEDLVEKPAEELRRLGNFIQRDLDYDRIQQASVGSVKKPLTSFKEDLNEGKFAPVGRWKVKLSPEQLSWFEALVGNYLKELGYVLGGKALIDHSGAIRRKRLVYKNFYEFKQWAKVNTPLSRWTLNYAAILIDK